MKPAPSLDQIQAALRYSCSLLRHHSTELAHAYLNHVGIYPEDKARADKLERQVEAEADRLAKQWGFEPPMSRSMAVLPPPGKEA